MQTISSEKKKSYRIFLCQKVGICYVTHNLLARGNFVEELRYLESQNKKSKFGDKIFSGVKIYSLVNN